MSQPEMSKQVPALAKALRNETKEKLKDAHVFFAFDGTPYAGSEAYNTLVWTTTDDFKEAKILTSLSKHSKNLDSDEAYEMLVQDLFRPNNIQLQHTIGGVHDSASCCTNAVESIKDKYLFDKANAVVNFECMCHGFDNFGNNKICCPETTEFLILFKRMAGNSSVNCCMD